MTSDLRTSRLSVRTLFLLIFVLVSSGPFGVEEMVGASGAGMALLLLLVVPLVWGLPLALFCTELASALPHEGGAYVWVERGLGRFWAFQAGWWSSLSGVLDTTLYVVLAVRYANGWLGQPPPVQWLMALAVIALFAALNVRSLRGVALSSAGFALAILLPCAAFTVVGLARWRANPLLPFTPAGESALGSLGLGLTVAIWFYSGYESVSTMAGEIEAPQRVVPRALLLSLPAVVAVYLLPTAAALASVGTGGWGEGERTLVDAARELGGAALALPMTAAALISSLALYNAYLASGARTTLVMAGAGLLPRALARVHPRFGTPHGSILALAAAHALLAGGSFEALLIVDVFLFVLSYALLFVAGVALRVREPGLSRPFRIPLGTAGVAALAAVALAVALAVLVANGWTYLLVGAAAAATGPAAYLLARRGAAAERHPARRPPRARSPSGTPP